MKEIHFKFDTSKLCNIFNIENMGIIEETFMCDEELSCVGERNGFFGKKHTKETKDIISEKIKLLYQN